jgi:hypothetical protein
MLDSTIFYRCYLFSEESIWKGIYAILPKWNTGLLLLYFSV